MAEEASEVPNRRVAARRVLRIFLQLVPMVCAVLLLTGLVLALFPERLSAGLFGHGDLLDSVIGTVAGGVLLGHPSASYVLGGELQAAGVGLAAVTALIVSWVTLGVVHVPLEAVALGRRFALWRALLSFLGAVVVALVTAAVVGAPV